MAKGSMKMLLAALALSGCATQAVPPNAAKDVPPERVYGRGASTSDSTVPVLFVRDSGLLGSGVYMHLWIDGAKVASLNPGERLQLLLSPGEHQFGTVPTDPFGSQQISMIEQVLVPGKQYVYRLTVDGNTFAAGVQRVFKPE